VCVPASALSARASPAVSSSATTTAVNDYQRELAFLGINSSPAFVREPEGNGCVERFIRNLKENLLWVCCFDTIEELRLALLAFRATYNQTWIVERHGYQTPAAVRAAQLAPLPAAA
jgi:putative transposase